MIDVIRQRMASRFNLRQSNVSLFPLSYSSSIEEFSKRGKESISLSSDYWSFSVDSANKTLATREPDFWVKEGKQYTLELFRNAAKRIPAYKDFLHKNKFNPDKVKTIEDISHIPPIDKENYLRAYPLESLCWEGSVEQINAISVSSGSSGKVFFWPRDNFLEFETTYIQEMYLESFFKLTGKRTLYLDCFAMGMYIAGPIILNSALRISQKGYPMVVMTPGLNMEDIMRILTSVGAQFDQIILAGYPPYIKDVIEEAINRGVDWSQTEVKLVVAGEGFDEDWRDYVANLMGNADPYRSIINLYGTADASIVGHETPQSIMIRRLASENQVVRKELFDGKHPKRMPTLAQYYPFQKYFEVIGNELHFTTANVLPLIRYNIHDEGGIIPYEQATRIAKENGLDSEQKLQEELELPVWKLPFVYLYGRSDFTVVLYGANIYPENIKTALISESLRTITTGRFIMSIERRPNQDPYLLVRVELAEGVLPTTSLEEKVKDVVWRVLLEQNDEYRSSYHAKGECAMPAVILHIKGDEEFFNRNNNKQRWTIKQ